MTALGTIASVNPRFDKSLVTDANEVVSFVPMAAVSEVTGVVEAEEPRSVADVLKGFTNFQDRDVLVAKITPCFENGKIAHARISNRFGFGSTEFHVIRPNPEQLDDRYLYHFMRQQKIRQEGERSMTGSAGQRRVPKAFLEKLELPLPPLPEQRRIAAILDKADALRAKRREAIAKCDQLLQSVFLEMFGDPVTNPKGWPVAPLPSLAAKFCDGPFGSNLKSAHYKENGVRVVRLQNIGVWEFLDNDVAYISEEHFASLTRNHCLPGDVLIGTLGDPNLRACILPLEIDRALNKADCLLFRIDSQKATREYVCALMNCASLIRSAGGLALGQTRLRISLGRLKTLKVPIAPILEQQKFSTAVHCISAMRRRSQNALDGADGLFESLQQRAFSGQLAA